MICRICGKPKPEPDKIYTIGSYCICIAIDEITTFEKVLDKIKQLHRKKNADYSDPSNWASNFEEAANNANVEPLKTFEILIGIKTARIKQLTQPGRVVHNEPLEDTLLDRAIYSILQYTYYIEHKDEPKEIGENS